MYGVGVGSKGTCWQDNRTPINLLKPASQSSALLIWKMSFID